MRAFAVLFALTLMVAGAVTATACPYQSASSSNTLAEKSTGDRPAPSPGQS